MILGTRCIVAVLAVGMLSATLSAGDLRREVSLIRKLGKDEVDRRARADDPPTQMEILAAARTIDDYFTNLHKEKGIRANRRADDTTFLRRVYLDIAGRIPTLAEVLEFEKQRGPGKRADLIDALLDSEAYVQNNFTFWADLLRVQSNNQSYYGGQAYGNWIKDALRKNKPYDQMVYELITADGYPWENGAAGFYLRDDGMPLDHMATTVQVFLGTSLQCAQCHDHPFDKWSQYEFYEMAAFTYGVNTRRRHPNVSEAYKLVDGDEATRLALNRLTRPLSYGVHYGDKSIELPHDYKYEDAKPFERVNPYTIFGSKAEPSDGQTLREAYAHWMTNTQNPRFTLVIANRLWKKVFGIGLIEPVDELTDDSEALHPQLMNYLAYKMESLGYDLKQFQRLLYNTSLYQREVTMQDPPETEPYYFPGPMLHRMTAEQFWDSLVTLVIPEPDYRRGPMSNGAYYRRIYQLENATPQELVSMARGQAEFEEQRREINDKIREARKGNNKAMLDSLYAQMRQLQSQDRMSMMSMDDDDGGAMDTGYGYSIPKKDSQTWKGYPNDIVRAAEMQSPAPAGHFLYQFGQSDRDVVNNRNLEPNIIQVLAMFNGPMFEQAIAPSSQLMKYIAAEPTPMGKVRLIYLSVLNREPTKGELHTIEQQVVSPALAKGWKPDWGKLVWALLNTREFSFVQ